MAWLQKRPQTSDNKLFYSVGLNKSLLLVGLGNPGQQYDNTRHNIGFKCLDYFVAKNDEMSDWLIKKDLKCALSSGQIGNSRVIAIKPTTFMNLSGEAVQATCHFYKITPDQVVVAHDDLDIDFGQVRMRLGGSSAGHNGIKSVSKLIGEDYNRVRIGIGPKPEKINTDDFVLQKFNETELSQSANLLKEVAAILSEYVHGGQELNETRNFIV